jgi:hypothetical protein
MTQAVHVPYTVEQDEDGVWCAHAQLRPGVGANGEGCGSFGVRSQVRRRVCKGTCSQIIAKRQGAGFRLSRLEAAGWKVADAPQG